MGITVSVKCQVPIRFDQSYSYLAEVKQAKPQIYLPIMNVIFGKWIR